MDRRLTIIGIGFSPLSLRAREALISAEAVLGSRRLVEVFAAYPEYGETRDRLRRIDSVDETMRFIHAAFAAGPAEIVLLGSGDPLFFGIGRRAVQEFGDAAVEIMPDLSSLQIRLFPDQGAVGRCALHKSPRGARSAEAKETAIRPERPARAP